MRQLTLHYSCVRGFDEVKHWKHKYGPHYLRISKPSAQCCLTYSLLRWIPTHCRRFVPHRIGNENWYAITRKTI